MALSNNEKQQRYRERHLGPGGMRERLGFIVTIATKRNLERIAAYYGSTMTGTIEVLINDRATAILDGLDEDGKRKFYGI